MQQEYQQFLAKFNEDPANANTVVFEFHGIVSEKYAGFSNFVSSSFELDGETWPTANHYFQAAKFAGTDDGWKDKIRLAATPFDASRMGKSREHPIQSDWDVSRDKAMYKAVHAKFQQNADLALLLKGTGNSRILCHNTSDGWWGDGVGCGGTALNKLGNILEEVRATLQ
jgi:N-glycosidase YbiA